MNFDALIECKINGISVVEKMDGQSVLVSIEDNDRNAWILTASAVGDLIVEEMRLQNIIEQISMFEGPAVDNEDARRKIFFLLRGKYPESKIDLVWGGVEKVVADISVGNCFLLEIEPVYGAYVLMIAQSISLERA